MFKIIRPDTAIKIIKKSGTTKDADGFDIDKWEDVCNHILCEWQNKFGVEVYKTVKASTINVSEPASLKLWFVPGVTPDCRVIRLSDEAVFEIVGVDDVMNRHQQLQLEIKRYVRG
ncbi:head-tail adaptor protein [Ruminiclostridium cellobioparum]|uniref:head-tail adaptor protein n=1 Tax=Ruminiclostridium cellobioparum TaxID=29355 RepID=UPI0004886774|nr:head-tail adaptor protein [Ruminiclostridium cellobioparum]